DLRRYALEVDDVHVVTRLGLIPEVEVDEAQFEQVFLNLLNNAQQALQEHGGEVVISTRHDAQHLYVMFSDNGPGVPAGLRARIFEPFFTTREVGHGQGMGLAIAYGVVTHHGGRTWMQDSDDGGATFVIELPLTPANDEARTGPSDADSSALPADLTSPTSPVDAQPARRVLVVDDEAPVRALTTEILGATGYIVQSARGGDEALALLDQHAFDLIVTDLRMPGMDG